MGTMRNSMLGKAIVKQAFVDAFRKLDPRITIKNPVMFVVEAGFFVTLFLTFFPDAFGEGADPLYNGTVCLILLATVFFGNFAESLAEGRGKPRLPA